MSENNRNFMIGVAAAGAVALGAAVAYYYWQSSSPEKSNTMRDKLNEAGLTNVEWVGVGQFDNQYFLKLLQFIGVQARERTSDLRKSRAEERRSYFNKDWEKYREVIKQSIDDENLTQQAVIKEILPLLSIKLDEFTTNVDRMAADPKTAEFVMAAQLGKLSRAEELSAPKLSR